jgi:hypothetical protein
LSFAALPVCVPRYKSVPDRILTDDLHRDRMASTPGCSARTYRDFQCPKQESNLQSPGDHRCATVPEPSRFASLRIRA